MGRKIPLLGDIMAFDLNSITAQLIIIGYRIAVIPGELYFICLSLGPINLFKSNVAIPQVNMKYVHF